MTWITTFTGKAFDFANTTADMIDIADISHALSAQVRFNGHTKSPYSVAQHSMGVAMWAYQKTNDKLIGLQGLLHDSTEAYIGDMVSPLKELMPAFREYEAYLWSIIAAKFGVSEEMHEVVKEADLRILLTEKREMLNNDHTPRWKLEDLYEPLPIKIVIQPFEIVRKQFMEVFHFLSTDTANDHKEESRIILPYGR